MGALPWPCAMITGNMPADPRQSCRDPCRPSLVAVVDEHTDSQEEADQQADDLETLANEVILIPVHEHLGGGISGDDGVPLVDTWYEPRRYKQGTGRGKGTHHFIQNNGRDCVQHRQYSTYPGNLAPACSVK